MSAWGLLGCGLAVIVIRYLEWSAFPLYTVIAWASVAIFNYVHWYFLAEWAAESEASSHVEMKEEGSGAEGEGDEDLPEEATEQAASLLVKLNKLE